MPKLTIELIAIRAVLELPESPSPDASERSEFTCQVLKAFRPLAKTRPSELPMRKAGGR